MSIPLRQVMEVSRGVALTSSRKGKINQLAGLLAALAPPDIQPVVAYLTGDIPGGRLGVGPAAVRKASGAEPSAESRLTVGEVQARLDDLRRIQGAGANKRREAQLGDLFAQATGEEQRFLADLLLGNLRQGALAGVMVNAVAQAAALPLGKVRRAQMFAGDLAPVAYEALTAGALERFTLTLFRPVLPMLASPAADFHEVFSRHHRVRLEYKLDGARVQVHKDGEEVRVYSRRLNDVTAAVPELVEQVRALPVSRLILDGETLALTAQGAPMPFQETMRRFGRRLDVDALRQRMPLSTFYFDCLRMDDDVLLDLPGEERLAALGTLPGLSPVPARVVTGAEAAEAFWEQALAAGHEGLMAKSLEAPYAAGGRGHSWLKLKPAHTLDLVVLAAEWGSGRRQGWLSNLHLGALGEDGSFVMLGKTFKGLTDAMLQWQTEQLLAREISRDAWTVYVRPELVVEVALSGVQRSPHYPGGMALRFARVRRYRDDKRPSQIDTVDTVRRLML